MGGRLLIAIFISMSIIKTCEFSVIHNIGFCLITGAIVPSLSSYYEMIDDIDDLQARDQILLPTPTYVEKKALKVVKQKPIPDEWKLRGTYRVKCVEETHIHPSKVVQAMSGKNWEVSDKELGKWALCVLVKLGLMSKEGVFKVDVAMSKIQEKDKAHADTLIDICLPKTAMPPEDIAWKYVMCHSKAKGNFSGISIF